MPFTPPRFTPGRFRRRQRPDRPRRLRALPIGLLLPNAVTVLGLCSGLTAIRFGLDGRWEHAVAAILVAAVFDFLDGAVARVLKAQSKFGAELDSLADVVSFGVAPAMLLYMWSLQAQPSYGWIAALALAVCCALRLARFNAKLGQPDPGSGSGYYFTGVPAPAGAALALMPLVASFELGKGLVGHPAVVAPWAFGVGALMVSTLPTFSLKKVRVPVAHVVPVLIGIGLLAAALVSQPWVTLTLIGLGYLLSLPVSFRRSRKRLAVAAAEQARAAEPAADA